MDKNNYKEFYKDGLVDILGLRNNSLANMTIDDSEIEVKQLGSSTTYVKIDSKDSEMLFVGSNLKYIRIGAYFKTKLAYTRPYQKTANRIEELMKARLGSINGLRIELEGEDMSGDIYSTVYYRDDEFSVEGYFRIFMDTIPLGKSAINTKATHYTWLSNRERRYYGLNSESIDKYTYESISQAGMEVRQCQGCGSRVVNSGVCPLCEGKLHTCESCGAREMDMKRVGNSYVCSKCESLPRCKGCGKVYNGELCSSCKDLRPVLSYHSNNIGRQDMSDGARFKIGLEIEKEDVGAKGIVDTKELLKTGGWVVENDGSLSRDGGFELISPVYPLDIEFVENELNKIRRWINAGSNDRCGGHIHVSDTHNPPFKILENIAGYLPLIYGLYPDRVGNNYSRATSLMEYTRNAGSHEQAINITDKTLEFRIFPRVQTVENVVFRLRLIKYMMDNPEYDPLVVANDLLTPRSELRKLILTGATADRIDRMVGAMAENANLLEQSGLVKDKGKVTRLESEKLKYDQKVIAEKKRIAELSDRQRKLKRSNSRPHSELSEFGEREIRLDEIGWFGGESSLISRILGRTTV